MSKNEKMCDCNQGRLPCTCKPAEVERLREELDLIRASFDTNFNAAQEARAERDTLRVQLVEAHALLHKLAADPGGSIRHYINSINAALSASAEPSAPKHETCKACHGEGITHTGIEESPTTLCKRCDGSGNEPAAPVRQTGSEPGAVGEIKKHIAELLGEVDTLTAEVERLRAELVEWKERCQRNSDEAMSWMSKHDTLRAQLAKAHALLRQCGNPVRAQISRLEDEARRSDHPKLYRDEVARLSVTLRQMDALSASAEPNAPKFYRGDVLHSSTKPGAYFECTEEGSPGKWEEKDSAEPEVQS